MYENAKTINPKDCPLESGQLLFQHDGARLSEPGVHSFSYIGWIRSFEFELEFDVLGTKPFGLKSFE